MHKHRPAGGKRIQIDKDWKPTSQGQRKGKAPKRPHGIPKRGWKRGPYHKSKKLFR